MSDIGEKNNGMTANGEPDLSHLEELVNSLERNLGSLQARITGLESDVMMAKEKLDPVFKGILGPLGHATQDLFGQACFGFGTAYSVAGGSGATIPITLTHDHEFLQPHGNGVSLSITGRYLAIGIVGLIPTSCDNKVHDISAVIHGYSPQKAIGGGVSDALFAASGPSSDDAHVWSFDCYDRACAAAIAVVDTSELAEPRYIELYGSIGVNTGGTFNITGSLMIVRLHGDTT